MKYLHRFPILDSRMSTTDLIAEAYAILRDVGPRGYVLTRCEWHRRSGELLMLCDAMESADESARARLARPFAEPPELPLRWVRDGLIWRAAA